MTYWGVDSVNPINQWVTSGTFRQGGGRPRYGARPEDYLLSPGDTRRSLFDFISDHYGQPPAFWGRYINTDTSSTTTIRRNEPEYLAWKCRERGITCKIAPVLNAIGGRPTDQRRREPVLRTFEQGLETARVAVSLAQNLVDQNDRPRPIADGVRIYADLEWWPATAEWLQGWFLGMFRSRYAGMGGIYGRVSPPTHFDQNISGFPETTRGLPRHYYWSQEFPYAMGYPQSPSDPRYWPALWSTQPGGSARPRTDFRAYEVPGPGPGTTGVRTVLWQYSNDLEIVNRTPSGDERRMHLVDLDVARPEGYAEMWDVTAP